MGTRTSTGRAALKAVSAAVLSLGTAQFAGAAVFNETEPNDNKASANAIGPMLAGDTIIGNTTGTSTTVAGAASADNFLISIPASAPGIYRNRLQLTSTTLGQTGTIRGLTVAAAPPDTLPGAPWDGVVGTPNPGTDSALQTSSTASVPPRYNTFYTFGRPTQLYYRVTGASSTTGDYTSTLSTNPVVPAPIGAFQTGQITITSVGQTTVDTEFVVFDSGLNPISGYSNDDESALAGSGGTTLQSFLVRNYAPGTYFLAVSNSNTTSNIPAPSDDDFRGSGATDFGSILVSNGSALAADQDFIITDGTLSIPVTGIRVDAFDANWYTFTVVPEPTSLGLAAAAGLGLLARRRRA